MYSKKTKKNSHGFTLIEIIASIALLGLIAAVFLPILPQMMNWSTHTDNELVSSNLLSRVASEVKTVNITEFYDAKINNCSQNEGEDKFFKKYTLNNREYNATLSLCKENEVNLYRTHIKIYTTNETLTSDSFTYISEDTL
ncbi:type II secretion system protein [Virgibacillus ndiopensis]|uniref:type II secretion system protein n=1 Tax=Virgibacillus ndiopensis TaxID=2004408 RepID=UPI00159BB2E6|nr:type II secretion system protein [Virgibacillus ndiopensis]